MPVVSMTGAQNKMKALLERMAEVAQESLQAVGEEMALDAATRAPTIDEEYNELMAGAGNIASVPREGDRSADDDGRIRLQKAEETYLENALINPENIAVSELSVAVGNLPFLNDCTRYSYFNKRAGGELSDEHVVGPYFADIEYGGMSVIVPIFRLANGHKYPLRPDNEPAPGVNSMAKSFSVHYMFNTASLEARAKDTLRTALDAAFG